MNGRMPLLVILMCFLLCGPTKPVNGKVQLLPCKFDAYDVNRNRKITEKEFTDSALARGYKDARAKELFTLLDSNENGEVTEEEYKVGAPKLTKLRLIGPCRKCFCCCVRIRFWKRSKKSQLMKNEEYIVPKQ